MFVYDDQDYESTLADDREWRLTDQAFSEYRTGTDVREGKGASFDTTLYEGYWKENKMNGNGRLILNNGNYQIGRFLDN